MKTWSRSSCNSLTTKTRVWYSPTYASWTLTMWIYQEGGKKVSFFGLFFHGFVFLRLMHRDRLAPNYLLPAKEVLEALLDV